MATAVEEKARRRALECEITHLYNTNRLVREWSEAIARADCLNAIFVMIRRQFKDCEAAHFQQVRHLNDFNANLTREVLAGEIQLNMQTSSNNPEPQQTATMAGPTSSSPSNTSTASIAMGPAFPADEDVVVLGSRPVQAASSASAPSSRSAQLTPATPKQETATTTMTSVGPSKLAVGSKRAATADLTPPTTKRAKILDDIEEEGSGSDAEESDDDDSNQQNLTLSRGRPQTVERKLRNRIRNLVGKLRALKASKKAAEKAQREKHRLQRDADKEDHKRKLRVKIENMQKKHDEQKASQTRQTEALKKAAEKQFADIKTKLVDVQVDAKAKIKDMQEEVKEVKEDCKEKIKGAKEEAKQSAKSVKEEKEEAIKQLKPGFSKDIKALHHRNNELEEHVTELTMGNEMVNATLEAREAEIKRLRVVIDEKEEHLIRAREEITAKAFHQSIANQLSDQLQIATRSLDLQQKLREDAENKSIHSMRAQRITNAMLQRQNQEVEKLQDRISRMEPEMQHSSTQTDLSQSTLKTEPAEENSETVKGQFRPAQNWP